MIATGVQNVGWEDSYLLGWREQEGELRLYVQVLLSDRHVGYRSFNEEQEHGCYRLGILRFGATSRCVGLPEKQREPRWECGLNEFKDVAEIDSVTFDVTGCRIDADDLGLMITADSVELLLTEQEDEGAFDYWREDDPAEEFTQAELDSMLRVRFGQLPDFARTSFAARYETLPGLPSTGPMPEQFSATGMGKHSEGFVVRFHPSTGESWVGNFQGGLGECEGVFHEPGSDQLIVVSAGQAYVVDPEQRVLVRAFGGGICQVLHVPGLDLLVFGNGIWFEGVGASGIAWKTRRLSWDGFRGVRVAGGSLSGEAYTPMGDTWHAFEVNLETGAAQGGSYSGP